MASNNEFGCEFKLEIEDFSSVEQKLNTIKESLEKNASIKLSVDTGQMNNLLNELSSKAGTINNIASSLERMQDKLNISKDNSFIDPEILGDLQVRLDSINTNTPRNEFKELQKEINDLSKADSGIVRLQKAINDYQSRLEKVREKSGDLLPKDKVAEAEANITKLSNALIKLQDGGSMSSTKISSIINNTSQSIKGLENVANEAKGEINSLGTSFSNMAMQMGVYVTTASLIHGAFSKFKEASEYVRELDDAMVDLKKVISDMDNVTQSTFDKYLGDMHQVSLELGTQSEKMVDATARWKKTGESFADSAELAKNTMLLTKVGDINVDQANDYLVAPVKAFNIEAKESIDLIDKLNNISNNTANQVNDLGEGLKRSASSMAVAGNDLNQTMALIAMANEKSQLGGSEVGNALKTISLRISTFKDEDGKVIPKLGEDLKKAGVDATDAGGQIKSTFDILYELSKTFNDLDKNSQLALLEKLGGKHHANVVAAILSDSERLQEVYELTQNSAGSAMNEFETYQESISYSAERLQEQMNALYTTLVDDGALKSLYEGLGAGVEGINNFVSTFGTIPSAISITAGIFTMFNKNVRQFATDLASGIKPIGTLISKLDFMSNKYSKSAETIKQHIVQLREERTELIKTGQSTSTVNSKIVGMQKSLSATTAKLILTKIASIGLSTAFSMLGSMAISMVITKIGELGSKLFGAGSEMDNCKDKMESLQNTLAKTETENNLIDQYSELKTKLDDSNVSEEEKKTIKEKIKSIQDELISSESQFKTILEDQNKTLDEQVTAMRRVQKARNYKEAKELEDELPWQTTINSKRNQLSADIKAAKELEEQINSGVVKQDPTSKQVKTIEDLRNEYKALTDSISENANEIDSWNASLDYIGQSGVSTSKTIVKLSDAENDFINKIALGNYDIKDNTIYIDENGDAYDKAGKKINDETRAFLENQGVLKKNKEETDKLTDSKNKLADAENKVGNKNGNTTEEITDPTAATKAFGESVDKAEKIRNLIKEINEEHGMTADLVSKIAKEYPEIGAKITDATATQEFLNKKLEEEKEVQQSMYEVMIGNDSDYYQQKIAHNQQYQDAVNQFCQMFVDANGNAIQIDLANFSTYNEMKAGIMDSLNMPLANWLANITGKSAEGYQKDLANFKTLGQQKERVLQILGDHIASLQDQYNALIVSKVGVEMGYKAESFREGNQYSSVMDTPWSKQLADVQKQLNTAQKAKNDFSSAIAGVGALFDFSTPDVPNFGSGSSGSKGGKKGSGSSNSAKKAVEDLKDLYDRYADLTVIIDKLNSALDINEQRMENAHGQDRLKLIKEQLSLYEKQRVAVNSLTKEYEKEAAELKNQLVWQGLTFNADGTIANREAWMTRAQNIANRKSGDEKENYKKLLEDIKKKTEEYDALISKTIPKQKAEWESLNNTIRKLKEEQYDMLVDYENKISDMYEYNLNKRKNDEIKLWEERKELLDKQYEEKSYEQDLEEARKEAERIQKTIDDLIGDNSINGRKKLSDLQKQLADQQKEISNMIAEHQKNVISETMDKEKENIEKEYEDMLKPENINKVIDDALRTGMINIKGEIFNLNDAMAQWTKEAEIGTRNQIKNYNELANSLKDVQSIMKSFPDLAKDIGLVQLPDLSNLVSLNNTAGQSRSINVGDIIVNVEGTLGSNINPNDIGKAVISQLYDMQNKY